MLTLQALLGAIPSARLAEADLPRFLTQALGRMTGDQLAASSVLLEGEQLVGFPRSLAPVMYEVIETMLRDELRPESLEPAVVERIIASPNVLRALEVSVGLEHIVLRPGEVVTSVMRELIGRHLRVLPGVGPHLTVVAPVEVTRIPEIDHAVIRSPALARPMTAQEAEALHEAWASIEETTAWPTPYAREWEARFVRIAGRPNFDAASCVDVLAAMLPSRRRGLWLALVEHHRHQELPEPHRPGLAGLTRRLEPLALEAQEVAVVGPLLEVSRAAYESCRSHPGALTGDYALTAEDIQSYLSWVEHSESTRSALENRAPEHLQRELRLMRAIEQGVLQIEVDPDHGRVTRLFRDQYLAAVYRRDVSVLMGVDPLLLARGHVEAGNDQVELLSALRELAQAAQVAQAELDESAVQEAVSEDVEVEVPPPAPSPFAALTPRPPSRPSTSPGINPFAAEDVPDAPHRIPTDKAPMKLPPLPSVPRTRPRTRPSSAMTLPPLPDKPVRSRANRPRTRPRTQPFPDLEAMPLPTPPGAAQSTESAEEPTAPEPTVEVTPVMDSEPEVSTEPPAVGQGDGELEDEVTASAQTELDLTAETEAVDALPPLPSPRVEPRLGADRKITSRLVTPSQASRFYSEAFRELQVLERDLLERGPWPMAQRRMEAFATEAKELAVALGPPARSGDVDFRAALKKVELVQSYLERIGPLMSGERVEPVEPDPAAAGVLDRLSGLFKRDDEGL